MASTEILKTKKEILAWMDIENARLQCIKFNIEVRIVHQDESEFKLTHAIVVHDKIRIYVWTEHTGYFYFYKTDLEKAETIEWGWDDESDLHPVFIKNREKIKVGKE